MEWKDDVLTAGQLPLYDHDIHKTAFAWTGSGVSRLEGARLLIPMFDLKGSKEEKDNIILWMDLETEGLNVNKHQVLEYAFLLTDAFGNDLKPPLHGFIKHDSYNCDPKAFAVHGITREFLEEKGQRPEKALSLLEEFLEFDYPN